MMLWSSNWARMCRPDLGQTLTCSLYASVGSGIGGFLDLAAGWTETASAMIKEPEGAGEVCGNAGVEVPVGTTAAGKSERPVVRKATVLSEIATLGAGRNQAF